MSGQTDFIALYEFLGVRPDCDVAELKVAYRRRVAELHPDRQPVHGSRRTIGAWGLPELTTAYNAAMAFQRRHGRLPGAPMAPVSRPEAAPRPFQRPMPSPGVEQAPKRRWFRVLLLGAAALAVAWVLSPEGPTAEDAAPATTPETNPAAPRPMLPPPSLEAARVKRIELGLDAEIVRRIEGSPVSESREHWSYGPSWIDFEDGKVSNWYSSPLHPLKVATSHPPPPPAVQERGLR